MVDPALKRLADRTRLAAAGMTDNTDQPELRALDKLLETLDTHPHISSVGEFFRDTEFGALFDSVEAGGLRWQELGFSAEELQAEFEGAWQGLLKELGLAAQATKSREARWSPGDTEKIRFLKQVDTVARAK